MTETQHNAVVNPTPLPTRYADHTFRSRLEARWAVFFDTLGIEWHYEPEGYQLPHGNYLPDFLLPDVNGGCWFEVKGVKPTQQETDLAFDLAEATGRAVFIAWGQIPARHTHTSDIELHDAAGWDSHHRWCLCPKCGKLGIQFSGKGGRTCRHDNNDSDETGDHPSLGRAYMKASSHRFWNPS